MNVSRNHDRSTHTGAILAIILVSYFIIILDSSVIFTALPSMTRDLSLGAAEMSWVQDAYTLVFGGLLLLGARLGDLLGRRRVFIFGLAVFAVASFLVGVAPAGWWVIAGRALQGIGAAIVAPSSLSLLTFSFPEGDERNRAVAWYGATAGIGASLGLLVGGACAQWVSWRSGFFINVPIGIAMMLLAPRYLIETERAKGSFDVPGAFYATLGVDSLVFGILHTVDGGWSSSVTIISVLVGLAFLVLLILNEARAVQPIMPLRLFASRERTGAYIARFFYMAAMIGFFYFMTQYLQEVLGFGPLQAGVGFLPMTLVNFVVALQVPFLSKRFGGAVLLPLGVVFTLLGFVLLTGVSAVSSYVVAVGLPMILVGIGQGLAFAPLTSSGIVGARAEDAGAASGLVNSFHQIGMSLGLGILVAVSASAVRPSNKAVTSTQVARQVSVAFMGGSVILLMCLAVTLILVVPATLHTQRSAVDPCSTGRNVMRADNVQN